MKRVAVMLLVVASGLAGWIGWGAIVSAGIPGCAAGVSGCGDVVGGRWGYVAGVPVAIPGTLLYLLTLVALLKRFRLGMIAGSIAMIAAAMWFIGLQAAVIGQYCGWCVTTHAVAALAAVATLLAGKRFAEAAPAGTRGPVRSWGAPAFAGVMATGLLALAQAFGPAPVFAAAARTVSVSSRPVLELEPSLALYEGKFRFPLSKIPSTGSYPTADRPAGMLVVLGDFTCPHCRELAVRLHDLGRTLAEPPFIVELPAWRDADAREIHRIMLTLRQENAGTYSRAREELLGGTLAPTAAAVEGWVTANFGSRWEAVESAHRDTVARIMDQAAGVLAANDARLAVSTLPQIMAGDQVIAGMPDAASLRQIAGATGGPGELAVTSPTVTAPPAVTANRSRIEFTSQVIEMGAAVQGETAAALVEFKNTGSEPLSVVSVKAGCGCTTLEDWRQTVQPGKSGSIRVTLNTTGLAGTIAKSLVMVTDASNAAGSAGESRLVLKLNILPPGGAGASADAHAAVSSVLPAP